MSLFVWMYEKIWCANVLVFSHGNFHAKSSSVHSCFWTGKGMSRGLGRGGRCALDMILLLHHFVLHQHTRAQSINDQPLEDARYRSRRCSNIQGFLGFPLQSNSLSRLAFSSGGSLGIRIPIFLETSLRSDDMETVGCIDIKTCCQKQGIETESGIDQT